MADKRAINILCAQAADYVDRFRRSTNWPSTLALFGLEHLSDENERLTRAQRFGDEDYIDQVRWTFHEAYNLDPMALHRLLIRICGNPDDSMKQEFPTLAHFLESAPTGNVEAVMLAPSVGVARFLDLKTLPDDFYHDLVEQINRCYSAALYTPQLILLRKLVENLVIDVLRRKYGSAGLILYFQPKRGRHEDFRVLLTNLESKLADFAATSVGLDKEAVRKMERFRVKGNSGAHTIDVHVTKEHVDGLRDDALYVTKLLVATLGKMAAAP